MAFTDYVIGIDAGTGGVRAIISNKNGDIVAQSISNYQTLLPKIGWAEQEAERSEEHTSELQSR